MARKLAFLALAAGLGAAVAACSPMSSYQGFQAIDQRPADVKVGQDTRSTVLTKLGSPTATSTFDKNIWFYMSQIRTQTSYYKPKTVSRNIVAISFDPDTEQVKSVDSFTLADGRVFPYNPHETPTRGREMTALEQMLGSIGASSVLPDDQNITPGSHPGDQH